MKRIDADALLQSIDRHFEVFGKISVGDIRMIIQNAEDVGSQTFGMYTGLKDVKGQEVFGGDILQRWDKKNGFRGKPCVVEYGSFNCPCCDGVYGWYLSSDDIRWMNTINDELTEGTPGLVKIGNIRDNPELLEGT